MMMIVDRIWQSLNLASSRVSRFTKAVPMTFPTTPVPPRPIITAGAFGCYIISYLPRDADMIRKRRKTFHRQLQWWMTTTDIPIHVFLSGWSPLAVESDVILPLLAQSGGSYSVVHAQPAGANRAAAFEAFYSSEYDWGIMMDDDAVVSDKPHHNRGPALFQEMSENGLSAYAGVDVFFPINPNKKPWPGQIWATNPKLYEDHHVFERNVDLKGTLFVVRNLYKEGKPIVMPDPTFTWVGEDRQFGIEAVAKGYSVMRCGNMVLKEFSGPSHSDADRTGEMAIGHSKLAKMYANHGLKMQATGHKLNLKDFWQTCWGSKPTRVVV